jgi:DNA-binding MarR family transcriptional regulator
MERHIGYWLKHLDRLIETTAERIFTEEGLTRRHWQTLNVLRRSPQDEAGLTEALRPFWGTEAITLDKVTDDLTSRGWLTNNGRYTLTPEGETAHAALEQKVLGIRTTVQQGLTDDDYHQTVRTLQHMAANLEQAAG